jgi:hypothetical protein
MWTNGLIFMLKFRRSKSGFAKPWACDNSLEIGAMQGDQIRV